MSPAAGRAVELASRAFGDDDTGLPLTIVVHGLLGQSRNWQAIAKRLAKGRRVLAVDLRNHGHSPWAEPMDYPAMAADLLAVIDAAGAGQASVVGHSMGGKAAMTLALTNPERVVRPVIMDVAPVPYRHEEFLGYMQAMQAVDLAACARRADVDAALTEADPDPRVRAFLATNIDTDSGGMRWLPNLDLLMRSLPSILIFPERAGAGYGEPALLIRGAQSAYVREDGAKRFRELFPDGRIETVENAGHWVHADQPAAVIDLLDAWLPRAG